MQRLPRNKTELCLWNSQTLHENAPSTGSFALWTQPSGDFPRTQAPDGLTAPPVWLGTALLHKSLPVGGGGTWRSSHKYFPTGSCRPELMRHDTYLARNNVLTFRACSPCSQPRHCHRSHITARGMHFPPELVPSTPLRCHCRGRPGNPSTRQLCNR